MKLLSAIKPISQSQWMIAPKLNNAKIMDDMTDIKEKEPINKMMEAMLKFPFNKIEYYDEVSFEDNYEEVEYDYSENFLLKLILVSENDQESIKEFIGW